MAEIERRALGYGLPPIRWPDRWPANYLTAMRVVTFAFNAGRGREFTTSAFTDTAHARGVFGVPTFAVGDELFWGDDRLEDLARCLT
jgi:2-hydroxychromene-2-carboxylate isomerase